jgi:catechol 2,3-dioxygenase-like lactoylglutathione lyase family enzyme
MRYQSTILYVPDVPAAVAFYESAFGLERPAPLATRPPDRGTDA